MPLPLSEEKVPSHAHMKAEGLDYAVIAIAKTSKDSDEEQCFIAKYGMEVQNEARANAFMQTSQGEKYETHLYHMHFEPIDFKTYERYAHFANFTPEKPLDLPDTSETIDDLFIEEVA